MLSLFFVVSGILIVGRARAPPPGYAYALGLLLIRSLQNDKLPKIFLCFESVINLLKND